MIDIDFGLADELKILRKKARQYVEEEIIPQEKTWPENREDAPPELRARLAKRAREIGLWCVSVPKEFGGYGYGLLGLCVVSEESARSFIRFRGYPHPLGEPTMGLYHGTDYQKEKYLLPVVRGEKYYIFAFSEPQAGSDFNDIRLDARRDGDNYILNGTKRWTENPAHFDYAVVYARTSTQKRGISCFLVDRETPGYKVGKVFDTMNHQMVVDIVYENCAVPAVNLLGQENKAFHLGMEFLGRNRTAVGALCVGHAQRCFDMARDYAKQRVTFGQPLAMRQAIQWMLADSAIEIHQGRLLVRDAACKYDSGADMRVEASMSKVYNAEMVCRVNDHALQIFGGIGYTTELPIERLYRLARLFRIGEGTSEMMRHMIARSLFKD